MGFVIAALAVAVAVALVWLVLKAADGSTTAGVALVALVIIVLGARINAFLKVNEKGPCHQYETRMMYNAATKTTMPYGHAFCAENGWRKAMTTNKTEDNIHD